MNALVNGYNGGALVTAEDAKNLREALRGSLYPGATDPSIDMVLAYCKATGLDPMTKPVHIVPMSVKKPGTRDQYEWRDVVMPGIELYRTKAHRTLQHGGMDEAVFGPSVKGEWGSNESPVDVVYPEWCRVTVYRLIGGQRVPFPATVYWIEAYAPVSSKSSTPNSMWKKRPFGQLEKCAEALALRKAFPEAVGAQPTAEEMEGRYEGEPTTVATVATLMPRALTDASAAPVAEARIEKPDSKSDAPADTKPDAKPEQKPEVAAVVAADDGIEKGIFGLSDSQTRILKTRAKIAGLDDVALLAKYKRIDLKNLNDVLADLRKLSDAS